MKLWLYIIRRILLIIPTLIGLTIIVFILIHVRGNNLIIAEYLNPHLTGAARDYAIQQLYQRFHLNDPLFIQYFYWLYQVINGDLGLTRTPIYSGPVNTALALFYPNTIMLALVSSILIWIIGIPIGVWSAVKRDSVFDQSTRVATFTLYAMPAYMVYLLVLIIFAVYLKWFPISGAVDPLLLQGVSWYVNGISYPTHIIFIDALLHGDINIALNSIWHFILPSLGIALGGVAGIIRLLRSSMLEVLDQDYIRMARSKGISESEVINIHARRNALIPAVTSFVYGVAGLLGGVVVAEVIFNIPGVGYWTVQALLNNDAGGILGSTLIFGIILVTASLILDIIYAALDPRVRY
jgi:ABC-type dipeptide/oligopeptide/nickel transport systems, permease components